MPAIGFTSTTTSPAAGLPVVLSVTVPVMVEACAAETISTELKKASFTDFMIKLFSFLNPSNKVQVNLNESGRGVCLLSVPLREID